MYARATPRDHSSAVVDCRRSVARLMLPSAGVRLFAVAVALGSLSGFGAAAYAGLPGAASGTPLRGVPGHRLVADQGDPGGGVQAIYDNSGNPEVVGQQRSWRICRPNAACATTRSIDDLVPGPEPAGTVFVQGQNATGRTSVVRTAPWQGTVHATAPPQLSGAAHYGAKVRPLGGSWTGGWGGEYDFLRVEACRTRKTEPKSCVTLAANDSIQGFPKHPVAVVGAFYTGWYLFALDERLAYDSAFGEPGYLYPTAVPPLTVGATIARSAPSARIVGPRPPRISFLRPAVLRGGRLFVARVRCSVRCRVSLNVSENNVSTVGESQNVFTGSREISVPRRSFHRGRLDILMTVESSPVLVAKSSLF